MNKVVSSSFAVLSAAIFVLSCAKEPTVIEPLIEPQTEVQEEIGIKVTINTGKPEADALTKTEMYGGSPYWSVGDVIGVSDGTTSNTDFNTSIAARATTASFSGTVASAGDYYAYYPYTSVGVGLISEKYGAKFDLPVNQNPTVTSYDGKADVLVSKLFTVTETTPTVDDLEFTRLGAIVKLVLIDTEHIMTSQHPSMVSMTAESALAGRVLINMQDQCLEDPYYNASNTVTANYTSLTKYEINGTNATYLIVVPQTLAAGSTLTIAASTEGYSIEKNITIPSGGIALEAGKITTLNISLTSSHITESSGLSLPFNDDFSWQNGTGNSGLNFDSTPAIPSAKYSTFDWIYAGSASGVIRMSKGSGTGYLTTVALDLSSAFYVHLNAKYWSLSDATHLLVNVDDEDPVDIALTGDYEDYYVNFSAATKKSKIKVTTTANKRAYLESFDVISGTYVFSPAINVTSDNPMDVANTASTQTITYEIVNPTAATLTAALQDPADTWITNIDFSASGEVTFDVAAQGSGAPARDAVIVLSYTGAADVEVEVNQAAGAGGVSVQTLYMETFGDNGNSNTAVASATTYTATQSMFTDPSNTVVSHYTSDGKVGKNSVNPSTGYDGVSGKSAVWYQAPTGNNTKNLFTIDKISISGASSISVSFGLFCSNAANTTVNVYYKIDSGTEQTLTFTAPSTNSTWTLCTGSIPSTGTSLKLRFEMVTSGGYTVRLDDIKVTGTK